MPVTSRCACSAHMLGRNVLFVHTRELITLFADVIGSGREGMSPLRVGMGHRTGRGNESDDVKNKNCARLKAQAPGPTLPFISSHPRDSLQMIHVISLLSAFIPLVQRRLSNSRHHPPHFLFIHHTFIAHEFLRRTRRNRGHADKDFGSDQLLKGLGSHFSLKCPDGKRKDESHTVIKTFLAHRTIPILPPST